MQSAAASTSSTSLPVFVFPSTLAFFHDEPASHKQVLTLYNPYDFAIVYKVLCTSPQKYGVIESEGSLKQRCCIDIVIRHLGITQRNVGRSDKFRIHISRYDDPEAHGRKDVPATLYATRLDAETPTDSAQFGMAQSQSSSVAGGGTGPQPGGTRSRTHSTGTVQYPMFAASTTHAGAPTAAVPGQARHSTWLAIVVGLICVCALSMPTSHTCTDDTTKDRTATTTTNNPQQSQHLSLVDSIPPWLHLSLTQKVTAAYVLGLVTVLLVRP